MFKLDLAAYYSIGKGTLGFTGKYIAYILFLFSPIGCLSLHAQNPSSFPLCNATWVIRSYPSGLGEPSVSAVYQIPSSDFDTLINGKHFSKIYERYYSGIPTYCCAVRYDTSSNEILTISKGSSVERLIMDQSKSIGDTLYNLSPFTASTFVNPGDTVLLGTMVINDTSMYQGHQAYSITEGSGSNSIIWYKNVGFKCFLFKAGDCITVSGIEELDCLFYNDTIYDFSGPFATSCESLAVLTDVKKSVDEKGFYFIAITDDKITIQIKENSRCSDLKLIDVNGKIYFNNTNTANQNAYLIKKPIPGIYLLVFNLGNKVVTSKFLIR